MGRFGQAAEGGRESKEEVVIRELRGTSGKEGRKLPVSFLRFLSRGAFVVGLCVIAGSICCSATGPGQPWSLAR